MHANNKTELYIILSPRDMLLYKIIISVYLYIRVIVLISSIMT